MTGKEMRRQRVLVGFQKCRTMVAVEVSPNIISNLELQIPEHMREGIAAYVVDRRMPGDFLQALISHDLWETVGR